jgi:hypothetical protein
MGRGRQARLAIRARVPLDVLRDAIQPFPAFSEIYLAALTTLRSAMPAAPLILNRPYLGEPRPANRLSGRGYCILRDFMRLGALDCIFIPTIGPNPAER